MALIAVIDKTKIKNGKHPEPAIIFPVEDDFPMNIKFNQLPKSKDGDIEVDDFKKELEKLKPLYDGGKKVWQKRMYIKIDHILKTLKNYPKKYIVILTASQ